MAGLGGTWEVVEAQGVDDLLKALGIPYLIRKFANRLYTRDAKIIQQKGKTVTFTDFRGKKEGTVVTFNENAVVHRKDPRGRELEEVSWWEGDHFVVKTKGYKEDLTSHFWRESDNTMLSETVVDEATMKRKWQIVER
ncbi:hypothetical protein HOP50_03g24570 [Chloropicon primus]|uniref:Lipocalin/cytosolic fatty-acid binding domain-containing protein n=1 Tax=Chloropicon primus TaxID=1764295 RepID=A0A5B8MHL2_9CHLO|nr:hypothetical protein A3770_03p24570 [Chloropicon primus]UPQ99150.1 hypothetical protein HOP50_03g24570 [Chloropicon primus]|eukprot:QDZ19939.1 hypothetical protein A3770_03p24570 [Chloropicon primus]